MAAILSPGRKGYPMIETWLERFNLDEILRPHVHAVILALPRAVQEDFVLDPSFTLYDFEPGPLAVAQVPVTLPGRCVVLKRTLRKRPVEFIRYVIAHELAHSHLRNRGRIPGEDPEHAADSLAASWGFPRPVR